MKTVIEKFGTTISTKYFIFQTFLLTLSLVFKADIKFTFTFLAKVLLGSQSKQDKMNIFSKENFQKYQNLSQPGLNLIF